MKNLLLLLATAAAFSLSANATIHTVTVSDFSFSPSSILSARVGDTIKWVWSNGSHTTTSASIPAGATPWDSPINSSNTSYSYKVTVPGAYTYVCTPHASMGMTASITVQAASGVENFRQPDLSVYPNPAGNTIHVALNKDQVATISMTNALGRIVNTGRFAGKSAEISTASLPSGLYYVCVEINGSTSIKAVEVKH